MKFTNAVKSGFQNYANFNGRASRSEYWFWVLFVFLVGIATGVLDVVLFGVDSDKAGPLGVIASLGFLLPGITVGVRRLHDTDRSGWWLLIWALIPLAIFVRMIIPVPMIDLVIMLVCVGVFIYWMTSKGTNGPNRFGNDPLFTITN